MSNSDSKIPILRHLSAKTSLVVELYGYLTKRKNKIKDAQDPKEKETFGAIGKLPYLRIFKLELSWL